MNKLTVACATLALFACLGAASAEEDRQARALAQMVSVGSLPPLAERLPADPVVIELEPLAPPALEAMVIEATAAAPLRPQDIDALVERGFTVLNVDRRGAGDSGGVAREAYTGPNGRLDAVAARAFLLDSACGVAPDRIAFVGASNGTTTIVDAPAASRSFSAS